MLDKSFPKIFVIILNFNGANTLQACLNSVLKSDYQNLEIVIVDNNSSDESFEKAKEKFSRLHFIKNSENIGFSRGNNVGIRFALEKFADYVFILNNDTIIEMNTISILQKTAEKNSTAGIISPLILKDDNKTVWFAGGKILWKKMRAVHILKTISQVPYQSEYLSGCAMLIKKDVFKKIGLFDERFFLYYEDADLSIRTIEANFKLLIDPAATIQHLEQSNQSNKKNYWLVLSGLLFFKLHTKGSLRIWMFFYILLRKIKNLCKYCFTNNIEAKEVRRAYRDFRVIL